MIQWMTASGQDWRTSGKHCGIPELTVGLCRTHVNKVNIAIWIFVRVDTSENSCFVSFVMLKKTKPSYKMHQICTVCIGICLQQGNASFQKI